MARPLLVSLLLVLMAGCARGPEAGGTALTLRPACTTDQRWDGTACVARAGIADLDAGVKALGAFDPETTAAALARAAAHPLDQARHVRLWEQRGLLEAYLERDAGAVAAFDMLLTLDPGHPIDCTLSPRANLAFEQARAAVAAHGGLDLELRWRRDLRLGATVPLELETVADPRRLMRRATIYLRPRGATTWQATDVTLPPLGQLARVRLPAVSGDRPTSLELYAIASDEAGHEVLTWASPARPREIPLRYDPPPPWYRRWWVWAVAGGVVAAGTGIAVYAVVWEPGPLLGGGIDVD